VSPLADRIRALIAANGPLTVAQYMAHCLYDPEHGYYMRRHPFGAAGDFITAPEVSQMFGEIVGAWLVQAWRLCGAPAPAALVELGPGRGTLMADILRVAAKAPDLRSAVTVRLVETSPALTASQAKTLAGHAVEWHGSLEAVPEAPLLLVANEFFDALPIRQCERRDGAWQERVIALDPAGRLAFGLGPGGIEGAPEAPDGSVLEVCPAADAVVAEIARRIVAFGGAALIVDYGHAQSGLGETLQAVRQHRYADPLDSPGEADLTAHVDFAALARRARSEGAAVHGPIPQGEFLLALGLLERAGQLGARGDAATRAGLQAAVERLAAPDQMGALFKVMAITRPGLAPPPFPAPV